MFQAMISCPKTGRLVPSGIAFGSLAAFDETMLRDNVVLCTACGDRHLVDNSTVKVFPREP